MNPGDGQGCGQLTNSFGASCFSSRMLIIIPKYVHLHNNTSHNSCKCNNSAGGSSAGWGADFFGGGDDGGDDDFAAASGDQGGDSGVSSGVGDSGITSFGSAPLYGSSAGVGGFGGVGGALGLGNGAFGLGLASRQRSTVVKPATADPSAKSQPKRK